MPGGGGNWLNQDQMKASSDRTYAPVPAFRDQLDALRSMWRTPNAEYPPGVLGTLGDDRRNRRTLSGANPNRPGPNDWMRGVNKGAKIDPAQYFWPDELHPMTSVQLEAKGQKFVPIGVMVEAGIPVGNGSAVVRGPAPIDPELQARYANIMPRWM